MCKFLLVFHCNYVSILYGSEDILRRALEIKVTGRSRLLKMAEFDRSSKTSYQSAIVSIALSCTIFELLTSKNIVTLKYRLTSLQVIGNGTIRKIAYEFLFVFHCNYGSILHRFRDKARYWSKIAILSYTLYIATPCGKNGSEYFSRCFFSKPSEIHGLAVGDRGVNRF